MREQIRVSENYGELEREIRGFYSRIVEMNLMPKRLVAMPEPENKKVVRE